MLQLQEIIYGLRAQARHVGEPDKPIEIGREAVNRERWHQADGKTFLRQGPTSLDITDMLTDDPPKFALVDMPDAN